MELVQFWKIIDDARNASIDSADEKEDFITQLEDSISELAADEIISFQTHLTTQLHRTFDWDVVAAAVVIFGTNCSPTDILGFRCWLISRGEEFLNRSLQEIDWLGEQQLLPDLLNYIELKNLAARIYEKLTADQVPIAAMLPDPEMPTGKEFVVGDLPTRLPQLAEDFAFFVPGLELETELEEPDDSESDFASIMNLEVPDEENPFADK